MLFFDRMTDERESARERKNLIVGWLLAFCLFLLGDDFGEEKGWILPVRWLVIFLSSTVSFTSEIQTFSFFFRLFASSKLELEIGRRKIFKEKKIPKNVHRIFVQRLNLYAADRVR